MNDRCRGALVGLAVGDALGAAIEFRSPGSFPLITTYRAGGPHQLNAGEWTDDTSMALALAHSLKKGWDLNDQAKEYVAWLEEGKYSVNGWCFDIGSTTREALENWLACKDATKSGLTHASASGNGGIMRIAPVAIRYHNNLGDVAANTPNLYQLGADSSSVTHASDMCKSAAGFMTVVLARLIRGESREEALRWHPAHDHLLHPAIAEVAKGSYRHKNPPSLKEWWPDGKPDFIQGNGFVVRSLEAALWAFHKAADYKEAVLAAVNLGEDSDTTGAICGQFAGAYWGESGIPQEWRDGLARMDMINEALEGLITAEK
jgi:ADP-ribosyl-[dinitrogen reductase] hydrolase